MPGVPAWVYLRTSVSIVGAQAGVPVLLGGKAAGLRGLRPALQSGTSRRLGVGSWKSEVELQDAVKFFKES
jgi:hypothetical protein